MSARGGILGLDLAANYGWAVLDAEGAYVASGHRKLRADFSIGQRCYQLRNGLADLITEYAPDWVCVERPMMSQNFMTARALMSYASVAEELAWMRECGFRDFVRSTCCKAVLGSGKLTGKEHGLAFVQQFKAITSHDEADAVLVALTGHAHRKVAA